MAKATPDDLRTTGPAGPVSVHRADPLAWAAGLKAVRAHGGDGRWLTIHEDGSVTVNNRAVR